MLCSEPGEWSRGNELDGGAGDGSGPTLGVCVPVWPPAGGRTSVEASGLPVFVILIHPKRWVAFGSVVAGELNVYSSTSRGPGNPRRVAQWISTGSNQLSGSPTPGPSIGVKAGEWTGYEYRNRFPELTSTIKVCGSHLIVKPWFCEDGNDFTGRKD